MLCGNEFVIYQQCLHRTGVETLLIGIENTYVLLC